jgi:hypothetical protein
VARHRRGRDPRHRQGLSQPRRGHTGRHNGGQQGLFAHSRRPQQGQDGRCAGPPLGQAHHQGPVHLRQGPGRPGGRPRRLRGIHRGLQGAAAIAACRLALHEAIDYAVEKITEIVTDRIESKILTRIEDVFTDRLDADGEDLSRYTAGDSDTAQDLVIEFDEFDRATGDYDKTRENFDKKKGAHKTGGPKRRSSVKKDSRFHRLAVAMDKCEDAVDKKADETVDVLTKHGGAIDKGKKEHKERDERTKRDIDGCDSGEVPMYLLNADGTVQRLDTRGDLHALSGEDRNRLDGILESDGRVWRPVTRKDREDTSVPDSHSGKVRARKVDPDSDDLAQATQIARYARNDYAGNNYAAGRYIDPDGNGESILIGYSQKSLHSERSIGYPILRNGKESGLKEIYTERSPCQLRPRCESWLDRYFPDAKDVRYSAEYDQSKPRHLRDKEHADYREDLQRRHGR